MKYGKLMVVSANGRYRVCKCACGKTKKVRVDHLKSGATISCGCVGRTNSRKAKITHGMSHTRVFKIWLGMLDRCKHDRQGHWGRRGIRVCKEWRDSFEAFYRDMGEPPSVRHSIERKNNNGNYEPLNCVWATRKEQARNTTRNTRLTYKGRTATIAEWSEITGLKPSTICVRIYNLKWSIGDALSTPVAAKLPAIKPWIKCEMSRTTWYRKNKQR